MDNLININNINEMNILALSFMGDAIHTLFIREKVLRASNLLAGDYHRKCIKFCNAGGQALVYDSIIEILTEEEHEIAKRAKNAKSHKAKNSSIANYKKATALEAVFGYLYLLNQTTRLYELLEMSYQIINRGEK